jgi:hypothetical protein
VSPSTAVVHLVRQANGMEPFEAFMRSFEQHEAGHEHELVLLFKGFESPAALAPYRRLADGVAAEELHVPDDGLDLTAYLAAARQLPHRRLCFVNSYTTIVVRGWLGLLSHALDERRAGVVGATGSWGSHRSFALSLLRLPNGYRGALGDRRIMGPAFRSVGTAPQLGRLSRIAKAARDLPREIVGYPGFPAPHVRTNAFLIDRELLLALRAGRLGTKSGAYRFEGGRHGMTAQVAGRGLTPLIVGRDGEALPPERWPEADIFWQGTQRDLLVADNQTRAYAEGTPAQRLALARYAWGDRARPE